MQHSYRLCQDYMIKLFKRFVDLQAYEELLYGQDRLVEGNTFENCLTQQSEFLSGAVPTGGNFDRNNTATTPLYGTTSASGNLSRHGIRHPSMKLMLDPSNLGLESNGYAPSREQEEQIQQQYESTKRMKEYFGAAIVDQKKKRRLRSAVANKRAVTNSRGWIDRRNSLSAKSGITLGQYKSRLGEKKGSIKTNQGLEEGLEVKSSEQTAGQVQPFIRFGSRPSLVGTRPGSAFVPVALRGQRHNFTGDESTNSQIIFR